jgi:hypothetical protein
MLNQQELERIQWNKINYFCLTLGINDVSRAEKYLFKANWDEKLAVRNFNLSHPDYIPNIPQYNPIYQAPFNFNQIQFPSYFQNIPYQMPQIPQIPQNNNRDIISNNNQYQNKKNYIEFYLSKYIMNCKDNNTASSHSLNYLKNNLNSLELLFGNYLKSLKNKRGIIIIYSEEKFNKLKEHINKINQNYYIKNLLNNCVIFPVLNTSIIGHEFVEQLSCVNFPTYIFNKYKNNEYFYITGRMDGAFDISFFKENIENIYIPESNILKNENKNDLIHKLKQEKYFNINNQFKNRKDNNNKNIINRKNDKINKKKFEEEKQIELNDSKNNNKYLMENYDNYYLGDSKDIISIFEDNNNYLNNLNNYEESILNNVEEKKENLDKSDDKLGNSIIGLSDGQILEKRENDIKELERQFEEKEKKEKEEENRINKLQIEYENEAENAKELLPEEPEESNVDVCNIVFRHPDGEKTLGRRFLKSDKVEVLFTFIKSKGREIFEERESNDFNIICLGIPPKSLEDKKNNTLEEEGLFPNSILQIRELQKNI